MSNVNVQSGRTAAPPEIQQRVRCLVDRHGVVEASKILGFARQTTLSVLAGVRVHQGTIAQADARAPKG